MLLTGCVEEFFNFRRCFMCNYFKLSRKVSLSTEDTYFLKHLKSFFNLIDLNDRNAEEELMAFYLKKHSLCTCSNCKYSLKSGDCLFTVMKGLPEVIPQSFSSTDSSVNSLTSRYAISKVLGLTPQGLGLIEKRALRKLTIFLNQEFEQLFNN